MKLSKPHRAPSPTKGGKASNKADAAAVPRDPMFKVSAQSHWRERHWILGAPHRGGRPISFRWDFPLHDGSESMDAEHVVLLESFREVLHGMLHRHSWWGPPLAIGSSIQFSVGMRDLFRWMVFNGHKSFATLDLDAQNKYVADLPFILTSRADFYQVDIRDSVPDFLSDESLPSLEADGTDATTSSADRLEDEFIFDDEDESDVLSEEVCASVDSFSYGQASHRVNIIYYVFAQRDLLSERGLPILESEPFGGHSSSHVTSQLATYVQNRIPPLPDEVSFPIVKAAMSWIEYKAKDVQALQALYFGAVERAEQLGLSKEPRARLIFESLSSYQFSLSPKTGQPWRDSLIGEQAYDPEYGDVDLGQLQVLRQLLFKVRDAALILLNYLVGVRPGEACSAEVPPNETGLPSCISMKLNTSGTLELFFFEGVRTKGATSPRNEGWVAGCRPSGSKVLPLAVKALAVVEELWAPWRKMANTDRLFLTFSQPKSLPRDPAFVQPVYTDTSNKGTRKFIFSEVDLSGLPNVNARGEELWKYRDTQGLCIKNSHWRKTFAAFVLESRTSLLPSVRQHFKHMSDSMTESGYFPAVYRLRQDADSARVAATVNWFSMALDGLPLLGAMAKVVDEWFDQEGLRTLGLAEREEALTRAVLTHDLRIYFSDHGNCLIRARAPHAQCRRATGTDGWASVIPDFAVRTPGMCAGCGCFAMDISHVEFWVTRRDEADAALAGIPAASHGEFRVISARRQQAEQVLKLVDRRSREG